LIRYIQSFKDPKKVSNLKILGLYPSTLPKRKVDLKNYLRKVMVMTDIFYIETLFPMHFIFALQLVEEKTKISGYMKNGFLLK